MLVQEGVSGDSPVVESASSVPAGPAAAEEVEEEESMPQLWLHASIFESRIETSSVERQETWNDSSSLASGRRSKEGLGVVVTLAAVGPVATT